MTSLKIAVPDFVSNSYFPAIAAVELGCFADQGISAEIELIFPVDRAYEALRDGAVDIVAGSAHSALAAFPEWRGVKLLCAQGQGMYWFLVMRSDMDAAPGDLSVVKGRRIGAAPWVEMGLRRLLSAGGIDIVADRVNIAPVPGAVGSTANFGLAAAKALESGQIDGFWANGMAARLAVASGAGSVVLDIRRGQGPAEAFGYTFASLATTDRTIAERPDVARAAVRAIVAAHAKLRANPSLAAEIGGRIFPTNEATHIEALIRQDIPYYDATIERSTVASMNAFCCANGLLNGDSALPDMVAHQFAPQWKER